MNKITKLNWCGPINSLGYGQASIGYLRGLQKILENNISLNIIGQYDHKDPEMQSEEVADILPLKNNTYNPENATAGFWHFSDAEKVLPGKPRLGMSTFELDVFNPKEIEYIKNFDIVGTASVWGSNILRKHFPDKKIFSAPHALKLSDADNVPVVNRQDPLTPWSNLTGIKFDPKTLVITSSGKFETRKGHKDILEALPKYDNPALLVAAWHNPFMPGNLPFSYITALDYEPVLNSAKFYIYKKNKAYIILLPRLGTRAELHSILSRAHCYMAPSYCEGWNLPLFEMMNYGMLCSATLSTAHLDYCSETNVIPISQEALVPAKDDQFFNGFGQWNPVGADNILKALDKISVIAKSNDKSNLLKICNEAMIVTRSFTWEKSAKQILVALESFSK